MDDWVKELASERDRRVVAEQNKERQAQRIRANARLLIKNLESHVQRNIDRANEAFYKSEKQFEVRHDMGLFDENRANDFVAMIHLYPSASMYVKLHADKQVLLGTLVTKKNSQSDFREEVFLRFPVALDSNDNFLLGGMSIERAADTIVEAVVTKHIGVGRIPRKAQSIVERPVESTTKFPPWDPPEPTDEQLLSLVHADTRQLYETGEMTSRQREQLKGGMIAQYKAAQRSRSSNTVSTSYDTYTIRSQIGQGANGFVYQATNMSDLEFALKILDPRTATEEKRKRFKNELAFCERNTHKNIIRVLDRGILGDAPFYVMHCYDGSLRDLMKSSIETQKILPIFRQILDGIEAAHVQNVIHRDLKPENILFDHASETPVIADFGIAHFEEEDLITAVETKDGRRLANFAYAAPEQCKRGQRVDHRADIYALGLILNEMFTATLIRGTNYKTIRSVAPHYSYLDQLVSRMLCNDPGDRPQTVAAVKQNIERS